MTADDDRSDSRPSDSDHPESPSSGGPLSVGRSLEQRSDALLSEALDLPIDERRAFLEGACGGDGELLAQVEDLLAGAEATDTSFLRPGGAARGDLLGMLEERLLLGSGAEVGRYRVLREIGRGGMGVVYLAERADGHFDQRVALKVLPAGSDAEALRRFARERQILADLEHPNIARLIDGGVTGAGSPYLIMEHVDGEPIDAHCRHRELSVRQRVALLTEVCTAVQAAHRQLIVHRDLKPSNILVTDDGTVKLLDFGIARLLDPAASTSAAATATVGLGTPQYASPEQVRGEVITVASDIYQLGLLAYELLAGRRPYEVAEVSPAAAVSKICHEEPSRPSDALSSSSKAAAGEATDATPSLRPGELAGDLDTIVLLALRKEPGRRYESVERLRDDLRRYLDGRPVSARPDTLSYRLGKFVRRNALAVAAAAAALLLIIGLVAAFTWGLARERDQTRRAAQEAREQREETEEVLNFLTGLFEASSPYQDQFQEGEPTAREVLERGAKEIESEFSDRPLIRARLLQTIGSLYTQLDMLPEAEEMLLEAQALWRRAPDERLRDMAKTSRALADTAMQTGHLEEAEALYREGMELAAEAAGGDDPLVAIIADPLARILHQAGRFDDAEELLIWALRIWGEQEDPDLKHVASVYGRLGRIRLARGEIAEARESFERGLELNQQRFGESHPWVGQSLAQVAHTYLVEQDAAPALPLLRQAFEIQQSTFGPDSLMLSSALESLGAGHRLMGETEEAMQRYEEALRILRLHQAETSQSALRVRFNLAMLRYDTGDVVQAEREFRELRLVQREALPPTHRLHGFTAMSLGQSLMGQGRFAEAEPFLKEAVEHFEATSGPDSPTVSTALLALGRVMHRAGDATAAEPFLRRALDIRLGKLAADSAVVEEVVGYYAEFLRSEGRAAEAEALEEDLAARQKAAEPDS